MITDGRVKELRRLLGMSRTLADSARMAEMSEKTARKYRDDDGLPSQKKTARNYRTRTDPFEDVWNKVRERLEAGDTRSGVLAAFSAALITEGWE